MRDAERLAPTARRPLAAREWRATRWLAAWLAARRVSPNLVSLAGLGFAALAAAALLLSARLEQPWASVLLLAAAAGIQARLLCNLLDGLVAIEGGLGSPDGALFNELPDRCSDVLLLAAAGVSLPWQWGGDLGWLAALLAVLAAYTRALGAAAGAGQEFGGPMAKPRRMALLSVACLLAVPEGLLGGRGLALALALALIVAGCVATIGWRAWRIARRLEGR